MGWLQREVSATLGTVRRWGQSSSEGGRQTSLPVLPLIASWVSLGGGGAETPV